MVKEKDYENIEQTFGDKTTDKRESIELADLELRIDQSGELSTEPKEAKDQSEWQTCANMWQDKVVTFHTKFENFACMNYSVAGIFKYDRKSTIIHTNLWEIFIFILTVCLIIKIMVTTCFKLQTDESQIITNNYDPVQIYRFTGNTFPIHYFATVDGSQVNLIDFAEKYNSMVGTQKENKDYQLKDIDSAICSSITAGIWHQGQIDMDPVQKESLWFPMDCNVRSWGDNLYSIHLFYEQNTESIQGTKSQEAKAGIISTIFPKQTEYYARVENPDGDLLVFNDTYLHTDELRLNFGTQLQGFAFMNQILMSYYGSDDTKTNLINSKRDFDYFSKSSLSEILFETQVSYMIGTNYQEPMEIKAKAKTIKRLNQDVETTILGVPVTFQANVTDIIQFSGEDLKYVTRKFNSAKDGLFLQFKIDFDFKPYIDTRRIFQFHSLLREVGGLGASLSFFLSIVSYLFVQRFFTTMTGILQRKYRYNEEIHKIGKYNTILRRAIPLIKNADLKQRADDEANWDDYDLTDIPYDDVSRREILMYNLVQEVCKNLNKSSDEIILGDSPFKNETSEVTLANQKKIDEFHKRKTDMSAVQIIQDLRTKISIYGLLKLFDHHEIDKIKLTNQIEIQQAQIEELQKTVDYIQEQMANQPQAQINID